MDDKKNIIKGISLEIILKDFDISKNKQLADKIVYEMRLERLNEIKKNYSGFSKKFGE